MGSRNRGDVNYRNPCLTMHQPWASLLVYGIKRIEGRSWPAPITEENIVLGGGGGVNFYHSECFVMLSLPLLIFLDCFGLFFLEQRVYRISEVGIRSTLGRLWIHAASKIPEPETIKAMEDFYREIYAVNGITDLKFPEHYPVSRLLGDGLLAT
ncbi:hypothetical protein H5410_048593 [Solanum commersonii]|uniref:ASCH domain-containing protein n=1 Tax=Solanum commersonii TaxID=4109 RepID=A0A9J5XKX5_SOLCO|nr:hypothetical protein H5410_048593 [Solanum commersonii]